MRGKRALVIGGLVVALGVPAGVALAATNGPSGNPVGPTSTSPGYGPGHGAQVRDPQDCPYYNSTEAQQWRAQREERQQLSVQERQKLAQQHREQMWQMRTNSSAS